MESFHTHVLEQMLTKDVMSFQHEDKHFFWCENSKLVSAMIGVHDIVHQVEYYLQLKLSLLGDALPLSLYRLDSKILPP